jgi:hypothetical protein
MTKKESKIVFSGIRRKKMKKCEKCQLFHSGTCQVKKFEFCQCGLKGDWCQCVMCDECGVAHEDSRHDHYTGECDKCGVHVWGEGVDGDNVYCEKCMPESDSEEEDEVIKWQIDERGKRLVTMGGSCDKCDQYTHYIKGTERVCYDCEGCPLDCENK